MPNPLLQSIQSAVRANETLEGMFRRAGNAETGRGYVLSAYRTANRALAQALQGPNRERAAREIVRTLKSSLQNDIRASMWNASEFGAQEAVRQLRFYRHETNANPIALLRQVDSAANVVIGQVDAQEQILMAYLVAGLDENLITGDEERQGVLRPSDLLTGIAFWVAALAADAFHHQAGLAPVVYQKQAIATLDRRTTDCCLRVHGQIQDMSGQFHLTGTPRFADYLEWTPFHWRCRTSIALYLPQYDDGLTDRMRSGADWFLDERAAGRTPDQHPANAFLE